MRSGIDISAGKWASFSAFVTGVIYALVTAAGLVRLPGPAEQIGQPYFALMECLILLNAPLMAISLAAVHYTVEHRYKIFSLVSVCCSFMMTAITSGVHFVIIASHGTYTKEYPSLFSFKWPSAVYALDILAWDWFYALAMLFGAVVFRHGRLQRSIQAVMLISGLFSLTGLAGVASGNMQVRNAGIIGYGVAGPFAFLLINSYLKKQPS